jgi:hypothetical protein
MSETEPLESLSLGGTQKSQVCPTTRKHKEKKETVWNRPMPQRKNKWYDPSKVKFEFWCKMWNYAALRQQS